MKKLLPALAIKLNGRYFQENDIYKGQNFSSLPVTIHLFEFEHKEHLIQMKFDLGNSNVGQFYCSLPFKKNLPDFIIETNSHFSQLFTRNKNAWEIDCSSDVFKHKLANALFVSGIEDFAKTRAFEPTIQGIRKDSHFEVITNYYLGFDDYIDTVELLIDFYVKLLDIIDR